jgi:hypothetical protein
MQPKQLLLMLPENLRQHFSPLVEAWREQNISTGFYEYQDRNIPGENDLTGMAKGFDAVMLAGDSRFSPQKVISKPFITIDDKKIPVGWLPVKDAETLSRFINTASEIQKRKKNRVAVGLLSQRTSQYLQVIEKMEKELKGQSKEITSFRWTSELVFPEDMLMGINCGIGAAIYVGHGRPVGWSGYFGIRMQHFIDFANEPVGSVLSLCCNTASRKNVGVSFSENLVMEGISASAFGAIRTTLFSDNTRWAVNVCHSLGKGITTIGDLITDAAPMSKSGITSYRLIGDPLAPLYAGTESIRFAKKIKVYY